MTHDKCQLIVMVSILVEEVVIAVVVGVRVVIILIHEICSLRTAEEKVRTSTS